MAEVTPDANIDYLLNPRSISKTHDAEGRNKLAGELREQRRTRDEIASTKSSLEGELESRKSSLLVRIKDKLKMVDEDTVVLQTQILEQDTRRSELPDPKKMLEAYYDKARETPLTNQEKREFLKSETLAQLTTDEYIALWKRLNPYFLTHVTRQGFRDHSASMFHTAGLQEFQNGFGGILEDGKMLRTPKYVEGLKGIDETSVRVYLSRWALQAENIGEAKRRFDIQLHHSLGVAPTYPDKTAVHFANQLVANSVYGGESSNEVFFVFPADVLASQHDFTFNGREKDFTHPQSEIAWNDIFIWPESPDNPGISLDSGIVFIPENTPVDPETGSRYASEVAVVDGKEKRVMVEDGELKNKFMEWAKALTPESRVVRFAREYYKERAYEKTQEMSAEFNRLMIAEMQSIGFPYESAAALSYNLTNVYLYLGDELHTESFQKIIEESRGRFKLAQNTVSSKEFWEAQFSKDPSKKPAHIIYYDGNPTNAIYMFQRKFGIGLADTSKAEGDLLGFDDHHITDMRSDPRANRGHDELVALGNRIIEEHYRLRV